jgi:hypothetical protein
VWKRSFHVTSVAQAKLNVEGLADKVNLKGQNVLVRVDLNVPLAKVGSNCIRNKKNSVCPILHCTGVITQIAHVDCNRMIHTTGRRDSYRRHTSTCCRSHHQVSFRERCECDFVFALWSSEG